MIAFWAATGLLAAVAAVLVLLRAARAASAVGSEDPTLAVYRRQLAEIDDLAQRGLIGEEEQRTAHAEAGRRLLSAADHAAADWSQDPKDRRIALVAAALADRVRREGLSALKLGEAVESLRARVAFLRAQGEDWPDLSDAGLIARLDDWLTPMLTGVRSLGALKPDQLDGAIRTLIPWDRQRALDSAAPARWTAPTGNSFAIDYAAEAGPRVDVRVQEVFGLKVHPTVGGVPLTLSLLSPGHRPVQTTKDLPGFWAGSWKDVRSDMRGRYPKHVWPEDPANAAATARAKPRGT